MKFSRNPFLGVLVGILATCIVQSSSVTVGIVLTLASAGLLNLNGAIPIVLGDNIGTCITAILASINLCIRITIKINCAFFHQLLRVNCCIY